MMMRHTKWTQCQWKFGIFFAQKKKKKIENVGLRRKIHTRKSQKNKLIHTKLTIEFEHNLK